MKRYGKTEKLYERICDECTIETAMRHSLIKHKYRGEAEPHYNKAQEYMIAHWDECKEAVRNALVNETYDFKPLHSFIVREPKERRIHCPEHFPDKIIMICVYIVLRDYFYTKFVRNTYNCIKGRGLHDAKRAIERIMQQHPDWYSVQTDFAKFYPTLRHDVLKADLRRVFKCKKVLRLLDAIIDVFFEGYDEAGNEIGIAIGINLSQLIAILATMPIIREVNEKWRYPLVAFTDDFWVAIPTKEECHKYIEWFIPRCAERGLIVKPNYRIAPMTTPVRMIGYEFRLDRYGNQYTLLGKDIKLRMQKRARQLEKKNVSDEYWKQQMASYFGWCKHACCRNLMRKTFGERYKLFEKNMKTFQEIKANEIGEFGLKRSVRVSIKDAEDKTICFEDAKIAIIVSVDPNTGEEVRKEKLAIKFRYVENNEPVGESVYLISGSEPLKDRALKAQPAMPFIGTIYLTGGRKRYYAIK